MKILAIDTSGQQAGAAVTENGAVLCVRVENAVGAEGWRHSQRLLPMVAEMLDAGGLAPDELGAVAYTCGPGSFTGLRIGVAAALGLARGWDLPAVAVPTLDAMAYTGIVIQRETRVAAVMDARRGQVYAAVYGRGADGMPIRVTDYFADDEAALTVRAPNAVILRDAADPAAVGLYASQLIGYTNKLDVKPPQLLYIRAPQAVREKAAREGMALC